MRLDNTARQQISSRKEPQLSTSTSAPEHSVGENLQLVPDDDDDIQPPTVNTSSGNNGTQEDVATTPTPPCRYPDRTRNLPTQYDDYLRH